MDRIDACARRRGGGGVTYWYRGTGAPVPGGLKLVRGEEEEMKGSD